MTLERPLPSVPGDWRPSWFDALTAWVDAARRTRTWVYHAAWIVGSALLIVPLAIDGEGSIHAIRPFHLVLAGTAAYMAFFMHLTKRGFDASLQEIEHLVELGACEFARLRRRVTTTPAIPTLVTSVAFAVVGTLLLMPLATRPELGLFATRWATVTHGTLLVVTSFVIGTFVCRSIYRIAEMRRLHTQHLRVDIFHPEPLYSQTAVAARGGLTLILYTLAWIATVPGGLENVGFVALAMLVNIFAVALYVVPLLRLHALLVAAKRERIGAAYDQVRALSDRLHAAIGSNAAGAIDPLGKGLSALQTEIALLEAVPTWPWHPELSRVTVTAFLAPFLLWSFQRLLQSWL